MRGVRGCRPVGVDRCSWAARRACLARKPPRPTACGLARPPHARSEFTRFHEECSRDHTALVVRVNEAQELFLGPVHSVKGACASAPAAAAAPRTPRAARPPPADARPCPRADDGSKVPAFWGFVLAAGIPSLVCAMLERSQMGLIFDLDETLLVAHSANTIEGRQESCRKARCEGALLALTVRGGPARPCFARVRCSRHRTRARSLAGSSCSLTLPSGSH